MFLLSPDYYQIKSVHKKGRGVFAKKEIPAGTILGDYVGLLVKDEKIDALEKKYGACYAMDYCDNGLSILPVDIKATGIHLINHSCAPNSDTYYYFGHTLFFTLRKILVGEEITIDYGFDPDNEGQRDLLHTCFCGSLLCRGTMYTSDERLRRYGKFCRAQTKNQKFKILSAGEILPPLEKYPKEIKDNKVFNLFANNHVAPVILDDKKISSVIELRKKIRETGKALKFINIGLKVIAIDDGRIIADK